MTKETEQAVVTIKVQPLELTTRCNSHCSFCPRDGIIESGKRKLADIDWSVLEEIVSKLAQSSYKINIISLSGLGEPLLYPRLLDAIKLLRTEFRDTLIKLNTNATLLRGELALKLIKSGLDRLICSMNVASESEFIRYKKLNYNEVVGNIVDFLRTKGNRKPAVFIRMNSFDTNLPYIEDVGVFWDKYLNRNDRFSMGRFSNWAGKIERSSFVKHTLTAPRHVCKFLDKERTATINLDGYVFPCCVAIAEDPMDSVLCLGNIREKSLEELYQSDRMDTLRMLHELGMYPSPCGECDSWGSQTENIEEFRELLPQWRRVQRKSGRWALLRKVGRQLGLNKIWKHRWWRSRR